MVVCARVCACVVCGVCCVRVPVVSVRRVCGIWLWEGGGTAKLIWSLVRD